MSQPAPDLRITERDGYSFDELAWWSAFRTSGLLTVLKPAAMKVLLYALQHATRRKVGGGEMDLPVKTIARLFGYERKSVQRGIALLVEVGLLEHVGFSRIDPRVKRYRLTLPTLGAVPAGAVPPGPGAALTDAGEADLGVSMCVPTDAHMGHLCPPSASLVSPECVPRDAQSSRERIRESSSSKGAVGAPDPPGLFAGKPGFDAAAAAILRSGFGVTASTAAGLVNGHGLTRVAARNLRANFRARVRAGLKAHNPPGLLRTLIADGETVPSRLVEAKLDERRRDRARLARRRQAEAQQASEREQATRRRSALDEAERRYEAMTPVEQKALASAVMGDMQTEDVLIKPTPGRIRQWVIKELAEREHENN